MIYFLRAGGHVKIGRTKDAETLRRRVAMLQIGQAYRLAVLRTIAGDHAEEAWLHGFYGAARVGGEWFQYREDMLSVLPPAGAFVPPACGAIQLRLSQGDVVSLDAYCSNLRRRTGEHVTRSGVIRDAIQRLLAARDPQSDKAA